MRDIEHIILQTLCIKISEATDIPTGRIFAKMPDIQFVNKYDGTQTPSVNDEKFPCIGMKYDGEIKYEVNVYGEEPEIMTDGITKRIFQPLGEIHLPLCIYLFTNSRKEQRIIGNQIAYLLASNLMIGTLYDEIPGEYFSVVYEGAKDLSELRPFVRKFGVKLNARVLQETSGYIVDEITTNIKTKQDGVVSEPESITNTITGDLYVNEDPTIKYSISEEGLIFVTEDGTELAFKL
jgi:hypothetical protein